MLDSDEISRENVSVFVRRKHKSYAPFTEFN